MKSISKYYLIIAFTLIGFVACTSPWDDHVAIKGNNGKTLMEIISENPQTSTFATILQKTGYDNLLSGDKILTVFAPTNDVLASVDLNDLETLKTLVKNHIAYSSYTIIEGHFSTDKVEMINTKKMSISGQQINGVSVNSENGNFNISTANGILHLMNGIIPFQKNIYEYLLTQSGNLQAEFIKKQDRLIMDMTKSVQIGVDLNGKPLYDTVWINQNKFLEAYPLNDESKNYTYALIPNNVVERIETKYAKYFTRTVTSDQDSIVRLELIKDCILEPVEINADGKYISVDGVKMDINAANILETYSASNGLIYKLSDADVKIYENKVKTIFIEAENYDSIFADVSAAWSVRNKSSLHGGKDVLMNSRTEFISKYSSTDSIVYTNIYFYTDPAQTYTGGLGKVNNCFIQFKPVINSVTYKIYWSAYDDFSWHYDGSKTREPVKFSMKMLLSFPEKPIVYRNASALFVNNFSPYTVFASTRFTAGVQEEKELQRCNISTVDVDSPYFLLSRNYLYTDENNYFNFYNGTDALGDRETLICPTYGKSTIIVSNTTEYKTTYCGPILLDYIKLVPQVDPNE
ncbi:exported hypothetical protein [uncultured Paludibacter sp.]|uniref:FAS1 domain-containing protein n=1 Tax=uncultured Paludibacter sp. TaxID=497635 RepID=A0A653AIW8_9BACT|nr:exported hypothetical protein [uncultured Paludibacter sp.]